MNDDSSLSLRSLVTSTQKELKYLASQDAPVDQWGISLIAMVSAKLHATTRGKVEEKLPINDIPEWNVFIKTLEDRCEVLEAMEQAKRNRFFGQSSSKVEQQSKPPKLKAIAYASTSDQSVIDLTKSPNQADTAGPQKDKLSKKANKSTFNKDKKASLTKASCGFCQQNHYSSRCFKYLELSHAERMTKVKAAGLCQNCLREGHDATSCDSTNSCFKCKQRHHTTVHEAVKSSSSSENRSSNLLAVGPTALAAHISSSAHVMLATALIHAKDAKGKLFECRTLLDSCAQSNFISQELVSSMKLPTRRMSISVRGIGGATACATRYVELEIRYRIKDYTKILKFVVLPSITGDLPNERIDFAENQLPSSIILADPKFHEPGKVDMLIGAEIFYEILGRSRLTIDPNLPGLYETQFGHIAAGRFANDSYEQRFSEIALMTTYESLEKQVKRFWQLEEIDSSPRTLTAEEQACEDHFKQTTTRDDAGDFIVRLPKRQNESVLGDSFRKALACFRSLERRFATDPSLFEMYRTFMREYHDLGHMRLAPAEDSNGNRTMYYIPHLPVIRPDSETTVLRTVFNASAKTTTGVSLNDILRVGPNIQDGLWAILIRFRLHQFVFIADIQKMYRTITTFNEFYGEKIHLNQFGHFN